MRVLYITPFVPFREIDHAGGYFLYKYLKELSKHIEISVLAPNTEINLKAKDLEKSWLNVRLVGEERKENKSPIQAANKFINAIIKPLSMPKWHIDLLSDVIREKNYINKFDLVEIHFSQLLPLVPYIKEGNSNIPIVSFEHDVYSQSVIRRVKHAPLSKEKIIRYCQLVKVKSDEKSLLNLCDAILLFSQKDKEILTDMGVKPEINVLTPSIEIPEKPNLLDGKICTFVGAMSRPENYESAEWFIREIWGKVVLEVPEAKLYIVGGNPPQKILDFKSENIIVTGFVDSLDQYYKSTSVFVAPLLTGAGVKFKVVQALSYGIPVVTTSVGAEGISEDNSIGVFPCISNDPKEFADNIISLLRNKNKRENYGKKSREWILKEYDFEKNTIEKAISVYTNLVGK